MMNACTNFPSSRRNRNLSVFAKALFPLQQLIRNWLIKDAWSLKHRGKPIRLKEHQHSTPNSSPAAWAFSTLVRLTGERRDSDSSLAGQGLPTGPGTYLWPGRTCVCVFASVADMRRAASLWKPVPDLLSAHPNNNSNPSLSRMLLHINELHCFAFPHSALRLRGKSAGVHLPDGWT